MNIVFGGSFNPPTKAHYLMAKYIVEHLDYEHIIFLPVSDKYKKSDLAPAENRVQMLEILARLLGGKVIVSKLEIEEEYKGTMASLDKLSQYYQDLYFVIGADNLLELPTWRNFLLLITKYKFIVFTRNNIDVKKYIEEHYFNYQNRFYIIDQDCPISSSNIRKNIKKHRDDLVDEVYEYIIQEKLYC